MKDLQPGAASQRADELTALGDDLYFVADDGVTGPDLWVSDGSDAGTTRVKDFPSGPDTEYDYGPTNLTVNQGTLFFVVDSETTGYELWSSDGTAPGTALVKDVRPGARSSDIHDLVSAADALYFVAQSGRDNPALWTSDGTKQGTVEVYGDFATTDYYSYGPSGLAAVGGAVYFSASGGPHNTEPWVSNGTTQGTREIKDLNRGVPFDVVGRPAYNLKQGSVRVPVSAQASGVLRATGKLTKNVDVRIKAGEKSALVIKPNAKGLKKLRRDRAQAANGKPGRLRVSVDLAFKACGATLTRSTSFRLKLK